LDNFYAFYLPSDTGGGGAGVSSINSLTGALTLVAGSGITITPSGSNIIITNSGATGFSSIGAIDGNPPSANGLSNSGSILYAQSASTSNPGMVNLTTQTFEGNKTFSGSISASNLSGTNSGDVTLGTANGLTLIAQVLSLGLASTSTTGALSSTDWNTFNNKQAAGSFANTALSNLVTTSINQSLIPASAGSQVLGSSADYWGPSFVSQLNDSSNHLSVDVFNRHLVLNDGSTVMVDYLNGFLQDTSGNQSVSWNSRILRDSGTGSSVNWNTRTLFDSAGTNIVFDWSLAGSLSSSILNAKVNRITNVIDPVSAQDAATKNYVDTSATGKVSSISVASSNGFAGTSSGGTTPALTLSTTITGVLKGNGTAISAAVAGTDYSAGTSALATGILKSTTTTGALSIAVAGDFPTLNQNTTGNAANVTGTVAVANGGTGDTSFTAYSVITGGTTSTGALQNVSGVGTTGQALLSNGAGALPSWGTPSATPGPINVTSQTSNYSALTTDGLILCSGGSFTITVYSASGNTGAQLIIRKTDAPVGNIITISGTGLTTTTLNTLDEQVTLISDGTNWQVIRVIPSTWVNSLSFTPSTAAFGTSLNKFWSTRREGSSLRVKGQFQAGTLGITNPGAIAIPAGLTLDMTTNVISTSSATQGLIIVGTWISTISNLKYGSQNLIGPLTIAGGTSTTNIYISQTGGGGMNLDNIGNAAFGNNQWVFIDALIAISGWNS
jgi:hypothetical protein